MEEFHQERGEEMLTEILVPPGWATGGSSAWGSCFTTDTTSINTSSEEASNRRAATILKIHILPSLQLREGFVDTFLRRLALADVEGVVDDSERVHQVGTEERVYVFWEELPPASSVLGAAGEVTDHFGRGSCNSHTFVMDEDIRQKTVTQIWDISTL